MLGKVLTENKILIWETGKSFIIDLFVQFTEQIIDSTLWTITSEDGPYTQ